MSIVNGWWIMDLIGLVYFWTSRFCRVRASIHALFYTTMFYETVNNYFLLCHTNKIKHQVKIYQKCVDRVRKNSLKIIQGCALAEPGGPWHQTLCPRSTRKSQIFHTNHMLGTLDFTVSEHCMGSLQFSLEHSLDNCISPKMYKMLDFELPFRCQKKKWWPAYE